MTAPDANPTRMRENRIIDEILVDAYSPEEWAVAWYSYLEDKLSFPFRAECIAVLASSPLRRGEMVEVVGLAAEDDCRSQMLVLIQFGGRKMGVPLAQLEPIGVDAGARQALDDWRYWVGAGYTS
jgi:hypothetical protein